MKLYTLRLAINGKDGARLHYKELSIKPQVWIILLGECYTDTAGIAKRIDFERIVME